LLLLLLSDQVHKHLRVPVHGVAQHLQLLSMELLRLLQLVCLLLHDTLHQVGMVLLGLVLHLQHAMLQAICKVLHTLHHGLHSLLLHAGEGFAKHAQRLHMPAISTGILVVLQVAQVPRLPSILQHPLLVVLPPPWTCSAQDTPN
jgi:hypothetical protein